MAWLKARWAWLLGAILGVALLVRVYLAGAAQGASKAFREGIVERAKTRKARATRYRSRAQAAIQKANDEAEQRSTIQKPLRSDWDELRSKNELLDREDG